MHLIQFVNRQPINGQYIRIKLQKWSSASVRSRFNKATKCIECTVDMVGHSLCLIPADRSFVRRTDGCHSSSHVNDYSNERVTLQRAFDVAAYSWGCCLLRLLTTYVIMALIIVERIKGKEPVHFKRT